MCLYLREHIHIKRFVIMGVFSNKNGTDDVGKCGICALITITEKLHD